MSEPPHTPLTGKIPRYFDKIKEVGEPPKVNSTWLKTVGYKSSNDRYILRVWKYIKFLDQSGVPTEYWKKYRSPVESKAILAKAIREGYSDLFNMYDDAHRKDREAIYAFFSTTGKAEKTINLMVKTFQSLCSLADFEAAVEEAEVEEAEVVEEEGLPVKKRIVHRRGKPEIIINIQLVLPESSDSSVYDSLFESLKRHLLTDEE